MYKSQTVKPRDSLVNSYYGHVLVEKAKQLKKPILPLSFHANLRHRLLFAPSAPASRVDPHLHDFPISEVLRFHLPASLSTHVYLTEWSLKARHAHSVMPRRVG